MGSSSGFPIDLVLFGMIAAFLVLRLRSILGRRTGYERPPEIRPAADPRRGPGGEPAEPHVIDGHAEPVPTRPLPDAASPVGMTLAQLRAIDSHFDPVGFLTGAEAAFRMIVSAFAAGHRDTLRPLLSPEMFAAFDGAITARESTGQTQQSDIKAIQQATIESAELHGTLASLAVRFVSDQISVTMGADNRPVTGTDAVTEMVDLWTFERDVASSDPSWRLIAARSA